MSDPDTLAARIRAAEAAVARRDAAFLREFDALSGELRDAGRTGLHWLAAGGAAVLGLLLVGALRSGARAPQAAARPHVRRGGWIAAALPLLGSLLAPATRGPGHAPPLLPGLLGLAWSVAQSLRGLRGHGRPGTPPLRSVATLDLRRYGGAWFEYARLPAGLAERCAGDVVVHHVPLGHGRLQLVRCCIDQHGVLHETHGIARPAGAPGRLEVSYAPPWLQWLPLAWAERCVLHVDADYRHAVVGTPDRRQLWLLARAPRVERPVLQQMVEVAQSQGFDIERLRRTPQRSR